MHSRPGLWVIVVLAVVLGAWGVMPRTALAHDERDPVCGMAVDPHTAEHQHDHAGKTFYF